MVYTIFKNNLAYKDFETITAKTPIEALCKYFNTKNLQIVKVCDRATATHVVRSEGKKPRFNYYRVENINIKEIKADILRSKVCGTIIALPDDICEGITLYNTNNNDYILYIPETLTSITKTNISVYWGVFLTDLHININKLTILGGNSLRTCQNLCSGIRASIIDVTHLNTHRCKSFYGMFEHVNCKTIIGLKQLDTSKVTSYDGCFYDAIVEDGIDITDWYMTEALSIANMFSSCAMKNIIIGEKQLPYITKFDSLFFNTKLKQPLDLSGITMIKLDSCAHMTVKSLFERADIPSVRLGHFPSERVCTYINCFKNTKIKSLSAIAYSKHLVELYNKEKKK